MLFFDAHGAPTPDVTNRLGADDNREQQDEAACQNERCARHNVFYACDGACSDGSERVLSSRNGGLNRGRITMKFVLVNERTPRAPTVCAHCSTPIGRRYLRDVPSQLLYCDGERYIRSRKEAPRTRSLAATGIDSLPIPLAGAGIDSLLIGTLFAYGRQAWQFANNAAAPVMPRARKGGAPLINRRRYAQCPQQSNFSVAR